MCKCNECDKKNTENCIRLMEACSSQQIETMNHIELEALKNNYDNLLKGIEKMVQTMSLESFWKVRSIEQEKRY